MINSAPKQFGGGGGMHWRESIGEGIFHGQLGLFCIISCRNVEDSMGGEPFTSRDEHSKISVYSQQLCYMPRPKVSSC